jgi:glycosyltransferase involved in cell wall biosynthesis
LKHAVEWLTQLDFPGDTYEIIIVDNGSTDSTGEIVRSIAKTRPNIVYTKEDRIGLSYARNAGILAAKGEFVAFIDDDAAGQLALKWEGFVIRA